jgi:hypothetical protein
MDKIYSNAELTIVASAGVDSMSGLHGIGNTPRRTQISLKAGACTLVQLTQLGDEIRSSKWNSRGWTFQEALLSRRRLVFTESEMYFQCYESTFMESHELDLDHPHFPFQIHHYRAFPDGNVVFPNFSIYDRLREFYLRQMSFDSDILKAVEGIFTAYQREDFAGNTGLLHFWGIPIFPRTEVDSFIRGLVFSIKRHATSLEFGGKQNTLFPSWSWAAPKLERPKGPKDNPGLLSFLANDPIIQAPLGTAIHFTHLDGTRVCLLDYAARMEDYTNYSPWIDITGWSILSSIRLYGSGPLDFRIFGRNGPPVNFDIFKPGWEEKTYMVICLYEGGGLVLEAVDDEHWRRVGVWNTVITIQFRNGDLDPEEGLSRLVGAEGKGQNWDMRTMRVV